jgi:hypothetical protein
MPKRVSLPLGAAADLETCRVAIRTNAPGFPCNKPGAFPFWELFNAWRRGDAHQQRSRARRRTGTLSWSTQVTRLTDLAYASEVGDADLVREGQISLRHLAGV